jgi:aspartokinase/homoserine dehydrogenase 1
MAGVPGTASAIFSAVKDVGANVIMISQVDNVHLSLLCTYDSSWFFLTANIMQASSEHSVCFAVPEKEVAAVSAALHVRFREALAAGRLSKVIIIFYSDYFKYSNQQT